MFSIAPILAALPFIHPWLAVAGGALTAVPIIIHLLNRRRFRRVVWAAMDWLLAAQRKNARRIRIEQLLLLLVRCLIMLLIGLAVAQPVLRSAGLGGLLGQARTLRVIVIDDSYSMNYAPGGADSPLTRAKDAAARLLDTFDSDDPVAVVLAGGPARPLIGQPSYDHRAVRDAIKDIAPTSRGTDLVGALKLAQDLLSAEQAPFARHVMIVADRTRSAWQPGGEPASGLGPMLSAIKQSAAVTIVDVGPDTAANLAITDMRALYEVIGDDRQVRVTATVSNFGPTPRKNLKVTFSAEAGEGRPSLSGEAELAEIPPGRSGQAERAFQFEGDGFHTIAATLAAADPRQLADDLLPEDNERFLSMQLLRQVRLMLVDGQPGRQPMDSEIYYLNMALTPLSRTGAAAMAELEAYTLQPQVERSIQPAPGWLKDFRLVALANVDLLSAAQAERAAADLAEFVRNGGGLMIFLGSQTDSEAGLAAYNRLFGGSDGLLPARLLAAAGQERERDKGLAVSVPDWAGPLLAEFRTKKDAFQSVRVFRHVRAEPSADATVLIACQPGSDPLIVLRSFGRGQVALITTSADQDWTNFGAKPDYPPLFNKLACWMAPPADVSRNVLVGQAISEPLAADQAAGAVASLLVPPNRHDGGRTEQPGIGRAETGDGRTARKPFMVTSRPLASPGFYTLRIVSGDGGKPVEQARFVYAVNPPASAEGDLAMIEPDALARSLGVNAPIRPEKIGEAGRKLAGGTELSRTFFLLVLGLCLVETLLAQRFGHFRDRKAPSGKRND